MESTGRRPWQVALATVMVVVVAGCTSQPVGQPAVVTAPSTSPCAACGVPPTPQLWSSLRAAPALAAPAGPLFRGRLLIYATHGFSQREVAALTERVAGEVTAVSSAEEMVASGRTDFPDVAVDTLLAAPAAYAAAANAPALAAAMSTGVVLASEEAVLRKVRLGDRIRFVDGRSAPVTAIVDAHQIGGHEMASSPLVLPLPPGSTAGYLLVAGITSTRRLATIARATWPGRRVRVRSSTANGYMSGVDTLLTQLQDKLRFGEFASRPAGPTTFVPYTGWVTTRLSSERVVQLGVVTCNRAVIPSLVAAMREVTARGLGSLIDTADFQREGGCWNPRAARAIAGGTLSAHSWGAAIDINVAQNPLGSPPRQDQRLVAIMAAHGFAWGGGFLRPDGAHFEWTGRPS